MSRPKRKPKRNRNNQTDRLVSTLNLIAAILNLTIAILYLLDKLAN